MTANRQSLLDFIRRVAASGGDSTDDELLGRFTAHRDEAAFATLVQRHGPMVLGVCQRVLGNSHDAEDAFQATFLVLARKAGSAGQPKLVAHWLYGVAYRTALRARAERVKRRVKERQAEPMRSEAPADPAGSDLRPVLDEEISRLPQKYRVPFVLCHLEGKTNEEAASILGCPKGTILSRLAWARQRLRSRLSRRGVGLSAALLVSRDLAPPGVPPPLAGSLVKAAAAFAAGQAVASEAASLAEGVLRAMSMSRVRKAALALAVAMAVTFAGVLTHHALAEKQAAAQPQDAAAGGGLVPFHRTQVSGDDILAVTGLNVYKFELDVPKGERFKVTLSEVASKDADAEVLFHYDFTKRGDGPVTLRASFLRRDRKMAGVLLSQEKEAEFDLLCEGCSPPGLATNVRNPLSSVPGTEKTVVVIPSQKEPWGSGKQGATRLLAIVHSEPGHPTSSFDTAYPRAELTLTRLPKAER